MIINTTIKHVINNIVLNQLINSNREQQTSRLTTLLFLCSMMVDVHIILMLPKLLHNKFTCSRSHIFLRYLYIKTSLHNEKAYKNLQFKAV